MSFGLSKQNSPFFSIVIPCYNSAETIEACLNTLLSQSFADIEILIIDGLSTDNTIEIVEKYNSPIIKIFSQKDSGIYDAMNKGISLASGRWLYFLGSDDLLYNNEVLFTVKERIQKSEGLFYYGNVIISGNSGWAENGSVYDGEFTTKKILNKNICHQSIFYNTSFVRAEIGNYNEKYKICADWDFNLRCWAKTRCCYLDMVISIFNAGGASTTDAADYKFGEDFVQNILQIFKISPYDKILQFDSFTNRSQVLRLQKEKNLLRYYFTKVINKVTR